MLPRNSAAADLSGVRSRRSGRVFGTALAVAAGLLASPLLATPAQAELAARASGVSPVVGDVTMVQANIYSGLSVAKFQKDVRTVLDMAPDFVTYNEVPLRNDLIMAPPAEGYAIHRSHANRYKAATAVAWRTDHWSMVDSGTYRVSNYRGKPPGRNIELGRRYANWVTLTSPDGRVISVVSAHVAPLVKGMPDLRRRSVKRIGLLVEELSPRGPVMVGGDFNVHYKSGIYPRDLLDAAGMVPTYDMLGTYFPTGDHQGATIDYIFSRHEDTLWAAEHTHVELNSDHDAVVAGLTWLVDAPAETWSVSNDPDGDTPARRAVVKVAVTAIRDTEPGSVVEIATGGFNQPAMFRELKAALVRGVHVRMTSRGDALTTREQRLARRITEQADPDSWFHRCLEECRTVWRGGDAPRGLMMVSDAQQNWTKRIDTGSDFYQLVSRQTRVTIRTGRYGLAEGEQMLQAAY